MNPEFFSLETLILMHLEDRERRECPPPCYRRYCDRGFLTALALENNT